MLLYINRYFNLLSKLSDVSRQYCNQLFQGLEKTHSYSEEVNCN